MSPQHPRAYSKNIGDMETGLRKKWRKIIVMWLSEPGQWSWKASSSGIYCANHDAPGVFVCRGQSGAPCCAFPAFYLLFKPWALVTTHGVNWGCSLLSCRYSVRESAHCVCFRWVDDKNHVELSRKWYCKTLPFPLNFWYPDQYHKAAEKALEALYPHIQDPQVLEAEVRLALLPSVVVALL